MTPESIAAIKTRLEKSIETLENQVSMLKNDLDVINSYLAKNEHLNKDLKQKLAHEQTATEQQLNANKKLIEELKQVNVEEANAPQLVSDLEKETISMLERMQQKVQAKEIVSDLYEDIADDTKKHADTFEQKATSVENPEEEVKHIKANQDMEKAVKKLKDQDALKALKDKLGM
ncbi:MAG: hypothetical protein AAGI07_18080 [Bacteroidota bacterium]